MTDVPFGALPPEPNATPQPVDAFAQAAMPPPDALATAPPEPPQPPPSPIPPLNESGFPSAVPRRASPRDKPAAKPSAAPAAVPKPAPASAGAAAPEAAPQPTIPLPTQWPYLADVPGKDDKPWPPGDGGKEWFSAYHDNIDRDASLDAIVAPEFAALAKSNPVVAANGRMVGDKWRTVNAMRGQMPALYGGLQQGAPPAWMPTDQDQLRAALAAGAGDQAPRPPAEPGPLDGLAVMMRTLGIPVSTAPGALGTYSGYEAAGKDILRGIPEVPGAILGGVRNGIQSSIDAIGDIEDVLTQYGGPVAGAAYKAQLNLFGLGALANKPQLPELPKSETVTGNVVASTAEFLTGFLAAGKFLKGAGWAVRVATKPGEVLKFADTVVNQARYLTQGFISDVGFFKGQDGNLANLLAKSDNPIFNQAVTQFLAANPDDPEAVNRLKNGLAGIVPGAMMGALTETLSALRGYRQNAAALDQLSQAITANRASIRASIDAQVAAHGTLGDATPTARAFVRAGTPEAEYLFREQPKPGEPGAAPTAPPEAPPAATAAEAAPPEAAAKPTEAAAAPEAAAPPPERTSADLEGKGYTQVGETDVHVNLAALESPADIQGVVNEVTDAVSQGGDAAVPSKMTKGEQAAFDAVKQDAIAPPRSAEEGVALRELWLAAHRKLLETANAAINASMPTLARTLWDFRKALATYKAINGFVRGDPMAGTKELADWARPKGGPKEVAMDMEERVNQLGGLDDNHGMAKRVLATSGDPESEAKLPKLAEGTAMQKAGEAYKAYWYFSLLSRAATQVKNAVSSVAQIGWQFGRVALAAQLNKALGREGGVKVGQAFAEWEGMQQSFKEALSNAARTWKTGRSGYGVGRVQTLRLDALSPQSARVKNSFMGRFVLPTANFVQAFPSKMLASVDEFFRTIGYNQSLHGQAYAQTARDIETGAIKLEDAPTRYADLVAKAKSGDAIAEDTRIKARSFGAYQTFTTPARQDDLRQYILMARRFPGLRQLMFFANPFVNTPFNMQRWTFENAPTAPVTREFREAMREGGGKAEMAWSGMTMGTMAMLTAMDWVMKGAITGPGPEVGTAQRLLLDSTGWHPFAIHIGDRFYPYTGYGPLSTLLMAAATAGEVILNANSDDPRNDTHIGNLIARGAMQFGQQVFQQSVFGGLADMVAAFDGTDNDLLTWLKRLATSQVPGGLQDVAHFFDPVKPATSTGPAGLVQAPIAALPGASRWFPGQRDGWGRLQGWQTSAEFLMSNLPFYGYPVRETPIDKEMLRDGWFIDRPDRSISINRQTVSLADYDDAYWEMVKFQGQGTPSEMLAALPPRNQTAMSSNDYDALKLTMRYMKDYSGDRNLLDVVNGIVTGGPGMTSAMRAASDNYHKAHNSDQREKIIRLVIQGYRDVARQLMVARYPELTTKAARITQSKEDKPPVPVTGPSAAEQVFQQ